MKKEYDNKIEEMLKTFSLKAPPPGMKEKILERTWQRKKTTSVMASFHRKGIVGCLILLIVIFAVDAAVSRTQNDQMFFYLDKSEESSYQQDEEWSMSEDIIGKPPIKSQIARRKRPSAFWEKRETIKRLTGWMEAFEEE